MQACCIDCLLSLWRSSGGNKSIGFTVGPGEGDGDTVAVTTQGDKVNTGYISCCFSIGLLAQNHGIGVTR